MLRISGNRKTGLRLAAAFAAVIMTLSGCASAGGGDSASLQVYSAGTPQQNEALREAFTAEHPNVSVTFVRLATGDLTQRVDAEQSGSATGADIVIHTNMNWFRQRSQQGDSFLTLQGPSFNDDSVSKLVEDGSTVVTSAGVSGFAWNTQAIKRELSLPDLVQDKNLRGRVGIYDFGLRNDLVLQLWHYEQLYGEQFLRDLAALQPRYYPSVVPMAQALGAGQIDVALPMVETATADLPVKMGYETEPLATPFRAAIMSSTTNEDAAHDFMNFLMSQPGQAAWAAGSASALPDIEGAPYSVSEVKLADVTAHDQEFYDSYVDRLNSIFGR